MLRYPSTGAGTSLAELGRLARDSGLPLRAIQRTPGAEIPVPSVVHWKTGHFAAIVARGDSRFLVKDLTFNDDHWVSRKAIDEESTGYMLADLGQRPAAGWREVSDAEAATVRGKGATGDTNPGATPPTAPKLPTRCGGGPGMPSYDFHIAIVSLNVTDTPVGYTPPRGQPIDLGITYNSREDFQPATFTFSNMGSRWSFDWLSYVEVDDPAHLSATGVRLAERGGGSFILPYNSGTGHFGPNVNGYHESIGTVYQGSTLTGFVRNYPDGAQDVYSLSDGAATMRKYFLTSVVDPAGNAVTLTYDAPTLRLLSITDPLGQRTTLAYGLGGDIYKITAVTDPFGRQATFQYTAGELQSVTDAVGMTSSFAYGPTAYDPALAPDFMSSMTTPYGTTTFDMGEYPAAHPSDGGNTRWLLATDPLGSQERIEFIQVAQGIAQTDPPPVPAGFANDNLAYRNTFYWNQTAMQQYAVGDPNRYLNATYMFHWLHDGTGSSLASSSILESVRAQGQSRVWFAYPGQSTTQYQGTLSTPTATARILDTGQEQRYTRAYDGSGRLLKSIDPAGRQLYYQYAANGIDLAAVQDGAAFEGQAGEQLAAFTYNSQHRPLTMTDYAGQTYTATYNSFGQLTSVRRPDGAVTNLAYDAQGFLTQVARAGTAYQESYTYDAANRLRTWTRTDGYTLTFDYDNLDRMTKITYPDGSNELAVFARRDVVEYHDRLGRVTRYDYDPADRLIASTDAANRTTLYSWCACGALNQMTDPLGHETSWMRDGLNRVLGKQVNGRTMAQYDYDGSGRLVRRTDALGQSTIYTFNVDDSLAAIAYQNAVHPTPGVQLSWDPFYPRLAYMNDAFGTTAYSYNPAGVAGFNT